MTYAVKEAFFTLQGEGRQQGRPAVFLRFAGCNLWSGLERDRATAVCDFCDTQFVGTDGPSGGKFKTAGALADHIAGLWPFSLRSTPAPLVVCTGGEPLLQLDQGLVDALHEKGFEVAVETNGTQAAPRGLDWICMSPKADAPVVLAKGDELKLVFPQDKANPDRFRDMDFDHFLLQPKDGPARAAHTAAAIARAQKDARWAVSLQTHKMIGID